MGQWSRSMRGAASGGYSSFGAHGEYDNGRSSRRVEETAEDTLAMGAVRAVVLALGVVQQGQATDQGQAWRVRSPVPYFGHFSNRNGAY